MQDYLKQVRRELDCRAIKYISLNKESHVLEVPDDSCRVPSSYSLVGHRKGFKRYSSDELKELVMARQQREEERERVVAGCLQVGGSCGDNVVHGCQVQGHLGYSACGLHLISISWPLITCCVAVSLQALEKLFVSHGELWSSAIEAIAVLDCLMALAGAAMAADGQMCRPKLLEPAADGEEESIQYGIIAPIYWSLMNYSWRK